MYIYIYAHTHTYTCIPQTARPQDADAHTRILSVISAGHFQRSTFEIQTTESFAVLCVHISRQLPSCNCLLAFSRISKFVFLLLIFKNSFSFSAPCFSLWMYNQPTRIFKHLARYQFVCQTDTAYYGLSIISLCCGDVLTGVALCHIGKMEGAGAQSVYLLFIHILYLC